uniref:Regulatory protein zeste n=1 Tax=Zeugodacus cucurbitae TaxID=28588 RepID=A0A0A1WTJ9_ZEUCU
MKLEAMNGNLVSLTVKVPPAAEIDIPMGSEEADEETHPQLTLSSQEQQKRTKEDSCGDEGEKSIGVAGKKKGTRKKRSTNWEEAERCLLVEVIKPKVEYVENRNVDAKSIKSKRLAWMHITKQFNALNFRHRSLEQIQVQWRSMKNTAKREFQQKTPNAGTLEGLSMVEFMEEMQKETTNSRPHARSNGVIIKKELLSIDDEDTPLAALPTTTTTSDDTLQASTMALPSPPQSAESQPEVTLKEKPQLNTAVIRQRKKPLQKKKLQTSDNASTDGGSKAKKQQRLSITQNEADILGNSESDAQTSRALLCADDIIYKILPTDEKYKKQIFDLIKRSHLAEIEHARIEHEQRLSFETMHQELKLNYYRKNEELKLCQMREEHNARMRQNEQEHKARMRAYMLNSRNTPPKCTKNKVGCEAYDKVDDNSNASKPTSED